MQDFYNQQFPNESPNLLDAELVSTCKSESGNPEKHHKTWHSEQEVPYTFSPFEFSGVLNVYNTLEVKPLAWDLSFAKKTP